MRARGPSWALKRQTTAFKNPDKTRWFLTVLGPETSQDTLKNTRATQKVSERGVKPTGSGIILYKGKGGIIRPYKVIQQQQLSATATATATATAKATATATATLPSKAVKGLKRPYKA